jgi:hypothetical protein
LVYFEFSSMEGKTEPGTADVGAIIDNQYVGLTFIVS